MFHYLFQVQGEGKPLVSVQNGSAILVRSRASQYQGLVGTIVAIVRQEGARYVNNCITLTMASTKPNI